MKKTLALLLTGLLAGSLFGCAAGTPAETTQPTETVQVPAGPLTVGFGREDITPSDTVHLQGGDWKNRVSTGILDRIFFTCVAITQDDQSFLLITMDLKLATNNIVQELRPKIRRATGIPEANIILAATHTHSSVAVRYDWDGVEQYKNFFYEAALKAVNTAMEDRSEAEVYAGGTQTERMTFVRHYLMNDGTYAGSNFGDWSSRIKDEQYSKDYVEYGKKLGQYAVDALPTLTKMESSGIKTSLKVYTAPTNKKNLDKLEAANEVMAIASQYGNASAELKAALKQYGLSSRHEANWIRIRANQGDTKFMVLNTLSVGNLAFTVSPYEMNGWHGKQIKDGSPYDMTFIITCAGQENYVASFESFDYNCYESQCCYYEQGTAEKLVNVYLDMLNQLKQQ